MKKKIIYAFLITLFLLLIALSNKVEAFTGFPGMDQVPQNVIDNLYNTSEYKSGNYNYFVFHGVNPGDQKWCFCFIDKSIAISPYLCINSRNQYELDVPGVNGNYSFVLYRDFKVLGTWNNAYLSFSIDFEKGLFSSVDIKNQYSKFSFYQFPSKEDITLDTFKFSQVLSANYSSEFYDTYNAYISLDGVNWDTMSKEYATVDDSEFIFYYDVFENGTYQIRVFDESKGQYVYDDFLEVDNIPFEIEIEPSENTDKPIIAKSNIFGFETRLQYSVYFSTDKKEWTQLNRTQVEPNEENPPDMRDTYFWTRIFKNGTYYFRFTYFDEVYEGDTLVSATPIHFYVTKEVKNLLVEDYMSDDYIFKPIISLDFDEEKQSFIVRTQSILLDKALNLNCFYISYDKSEGFNPNEEITEDNILGWNKMEIGFENNVYMNTSDGYFYFEIPAINAIDTSYKIVFYNYISEKASEIVYYDFIYENAKDYVENDLKIHLGISVHLNDLLKSFESRFGILGFPMSILRNFSNKILTLQLKEPVVYIPTLYDPFYHNKIFDGTSFNFNSLLVSDSVIFIHEFYLTIVDITFIYLFLKFCVKTLRDFIEKDK